MAEEQENLNNSSFKFLGQPSVTKCRFELFSDSSKLTKLTPQLQTTSKYSTSKKEVNVFISLKVKGFDESTASELFELEVNTFAQFVGDQNCQEKDLQNFAKANAPAIVFPFVRASVANLCFAANTPPITLPIINFHKINVDLEKID